MILNSLNKAFLEHGYELVATKSELQQQNFHSKGIASFLILFGRLVGRFYKTLFWKALLKDGQKQSVQSHPRETAESYLLILIFPVEETKDWLVHFIRLLQNLPKEDHEGACQMSLSCQYRAPIVCPSPLIISLRLERQNSVSVFTH